MHRQVVLAALKPRGARVEVHQLDSLVVAPRGDEVTLGAPGQAVDGALVVLDQAFPYGLFLKVVTIDHWGNFLDGHDHWADHWGKFLDGRDHWANHWGENLP